MTTELNNAPVGNSKKAKSDALSQGLWKALWIAVAICILWLGFEGGIRLYHRPAQLDGRVAELEAKLATVMAHEADLEAVLKGNLETEKVIAPVAAKMTAVLNQINQLPMTALPAAPSTTPVSPSKAPSLTDKVFSAIQRMGDQLVRVQVVGDIKDLALTPAAQDLVRQQLRLSLLSARMAWLSNMPAVAKEDLTQAQQLLTKHFQAQSTAVVNVQKMLVDIQADIAKPVVAKKGP